MNAQKTIDTMEVAIAEVEWNYPLDYAIAFEEAIKALKKQIPRKVIFGYDEQDYVCCPRCKSEIASMDDCYYYHCPECGEKDAILQGDNYCFNCGQALDWSDTKEAGE